MNINKNYCALSKEIADFFNDKKKEYILFEEDDKTNTNIRIKINTSSDSILIENADKKLQKYFNNLFDNKKCADYILLTENNSGKYDVHIFELCKTFNNKKYNLEKQLEGAFLRLDCILRYYHDIEIDNYIFYCVTENFGTTPSNYRFANKGNKISKFPKEEFQLDINSNNLFYGKLEIFILKSDYDLNNYILEYDI